MRAVQLRTEFADTAPNHHSTTVSTAIIARAFSILAILLLTALEHQAIGSTVRVQTSSGETEILYDQSVALLIGGTEYSHGWNSLHSVQSDLENVAAALREQGFDVKPILLNESAENIGRALRQITTDTFSKNSRLLVYISLHGWYESTEQDGWLVAADTPLPDPNAMGEFRRRAISMEDVRAWIRRSQATHTLVVLDSCYSGAMIAFKSGERPLTQVQLDSVRQRAQLAITSGSATQRVPASSAFANTFVRAIRGDADQAPYGGTPDGLITVSEIGEWMRHEIPSHTPLAGDLLSNGRGGQFVFLPQRRRFVSAVPGSLMGKSETAPVTSPGGILLSKNAISPGTAAVVQFP
jgi:hypothetical protein